jgi:ferredoxin
MEVLPVSRVKAFSGLIAKLFRKPVTVEESFGFLADTFRWLPRRDDEKCTGCGACSERCSTGATTVTDAGTERTVSIDSWMCIYCGRCADVCPEKALELNFEPGTEEEKNARKEIYRAGGDGDSYVRQISLAHGSEEPKKTVDTKLPLQMCSVCGEAMPVTEKYLAAIEERTLRNLRPETASVIEKDMGRYLRTCIACRRKHSLEWGTHPRKFI